MNQSQRCDLFLKRVADLPVQPPERVWYTNSGFLACLAAGRLDRGNEMLREKADLCITFTSDCSDFLLNLLIRAWLLYPDRITADNKDRIRLAVVGSRYYGGHRSNYPMFYNSENHHMSWATAEFLGAQLFPDTVFTFDGRSAKAHYDRARFLCANWLDRRGRWGYNEWNSSAYMGINLMSLLNLADFARDPAIRRLATDATTKLLADLAADSLGGAVWGAQARTYEQYLFHGYNQPAAAALVLLLGAGDPERLLVMGGVGDIIATTAYKAPDWLCRLAADPSAPLRNEERHRIEGDLFYSCRSAFWRPPFELTNEAARQQFAPESLSDAAVRTERTADYIVSTSVLPLSYRKVDAQALYWMGNLGGSVPIMVTHPFKAGADRGEERYWAGASSVPRCFLHDAAVGAVYAAGPQSADFTHAYFPTAELDEWTRNGRWFIGRLRDGYVGIRAPEGAELTAAGRWAGSEILAPGQRAAWLTVFGSKTRDGGLPGFAARCGALPVAESADPLALEWTSAGARIRVSLAEGVSVNGKPFSCAQWPQMNNAVVRHEYGSAITEITGAGGATSTLNFTAAGDICKEWERQD